MHAHFCKKMMISLECAESKSQRNAGQWKGTNKLFCATATLIIATKATNVTVALILTTELPQSPKTTKPKILPHKILPRKALLAVLLQLLQYLCHSLFQPLFYLGYNKCKTKNITSFLSLRILMSHRYQNFDMKHDSKNCYLSEQILKIVPVTLFWPHTLKGLINISQFKNEIGSSLVYFGTYFK